MGWAAVDAVGEHVPHRRSGAPRHEGPMPIILGSQSQGRRPLLSAMGYAFAVMPAHIDERAIRADDPGVLTLALAHAKADALLPQIREPALLITSDQVVVWQGTIREKPAHAEEARAF